MHSYSDEQNEFLKAQWAKGSTCSQIADAFCLAFPGTGISRNAVIGKVHRMGLPTRASQTRTNHRPRRSMRLKKAPPPALKSAMRGIWANAPDTGPSPMPKDDDPLAHPDRKAMADLEADECRWPLGDRQDEHFGFCGHEKVAGLPYCEPHALRAYRPMPGAPYTPPPAKIPRLRALRPVKLDEVL